jgi:poly-beta-1,6-N-acetyl-D-glucosamine biosynthesis protein PgaD
MTVPTPVAPVSWPPIIRNAALPRIILWRDRICTTAMWFLLFWLCRSALQALWHTSWSLFENGHLRFAGWSEKVAGLQPYFMIVGLFAVWAIVWAMVTLWRRQRYLRLPQPPALTLEEEAHKICGVPADLLAWRELKLCVVHLDSQGNASVLPKTPVGNR